MKIIKSILLWLTLGLISSNANAAEFNAKAFANNYCNA